MSELRCFKLLREHCNVQDCKTNRDRLSELPAELIEKILVGIPTLDAIKTCVLSKNWRYKWTKLLHLLLDASFFCQASSIRVAAFDYVHIINSIMMQHIGPLKEFYLVIPDMAPARIDNIGRVILTVLRQGIERLTIYKWGSQSFSWSSSFPNSPSLTYLELTYCEINQEIFSRGFQNLTSLILNVPVSCNSDTLSSCISNSPNLQKLRLEKLKFEDDILRICAPKLEYLFVRGKFKSICLPESKNLKEMDIYLWYMEEYCMWSMEYLIDFFGNLNQLESLRVDASTIYEWIQLARDLSVLPRGLGQLRFIRLIEVNFWDAAMLGSFLCVILSSPRLSLLEIVASSSYPSWKEDEFEPKVDENRRLEHLRKIYIGPVTGTENELNVIKILLGCSPALQEIAICCDVWPHRWAECEELSRAAARFPCASPDVVINIFSRYQDSYFMT